MRETFTLICPFGVPHFKLHLECLVQAGRMFDIQTAQVARIASRGIGTVALRLPQTSWRSNVRHLWIIFPLSRALAGAPGLPPMGALQRYPVGNTGVAATVGLAPHHSQSASLDAPCAARAAVGVNMQSASQRSPSNLGRKTFSARNRRTVPCTGLLLIPESRVRCHQRAPHHRGKKPSISIHAGIREWGLPCACTTSHMNLG